MALGDHIMAKRWRGLYYHHGIDMGDGTVIHLDGEPFRHKTSSVCCTTMEDFLKGNPRIVVAYKNTIPTLTPSETAEKARELLDTKGYNLAHNNCEHFATYCKTGESASKQVKFYVRAGSVIAFVGLCGIEIAVRKRLFTKIRRKIRS